MTASWTVHLLKVKVARPLVLAMAAAAGSGAAVDAATAVDAVAKDQEAALLETVQ